jgi:hypothetical protein
MAPILLWCEELKTRIPRVDGDSAGMDDVDRVAEADIQHTTQTLDVRVEIRAVDEDSHVVYAVNGLLRLHVLVQYQLGLGGLPAEGVLVTRDTTEGHVGEVNTESVRVRFR